MPGMDGSMRPGMDGSMADMVDCETCLQEFEANNGCEAAKKGDEAAMDRAKPDDPACEACGGLVMSYCDVDMGSMPGMDGSMPGGPTYDESDWGYEYDFDDDYDYDYDYD